MKLLSIRDKLVLYSSMIICLVAIANTVGTYFNERNQSLNNYQHEAMRAAQILAPDIAAYIISGQTPNLEQELEKLKVNPEIQDAIIMDHTGKMLADIATESKQARGNRQFFQPFMEQVFLEKTIATYIKGRNMVVGGPLYDKDAVIGYLYIHYSLDKEYERIRVMLFINLLVLGVCLTIGLILARILSNHFTKPILELIQLTNKISSGSKEITFPEQSNREFGVLSQAIKIMTQNLYQIHERLEESAIELDKKVKERTAELEVAIRKAKEANEEKTRFLANVSHEIRTPMNGIVGTASLLKNTKLDHEQLKYLDIMQLSAETLLNLINDILDLSKIESGKLDVENIPFSIRKVAQDVVDILTYRVNEKGLDFGCIVAQDLPQSIMGDPGRVRQILLNLVTNAVKFTYEGFIKITIKVEKEDPNDFVIKFMVEDSGIGIPPSKMDKLFQAFSQVDTSTTRQYGGTGLGLAISKKLAQMMGGDIGVSSESGNGSTFWFTISCNKDVNAKPIEYAKVLKDKSILILENNLINLEFINNLFNAYGIIPKLTRKEAIAITAIQKAENPKSFDGMILNENLVSQALMDEVRGYLQKRNIPIIVLSHDKNITEFKNRYHLSECELVSIPLKESEFYNALLTGFGDNIQNLESPVQSDASEIKPIANANETNVLVVDDNLISQQVSIKMLEKMGFLVHGANNGLEALEAIEVIPFDIILMDCQMPEMDGFEATRLIRNNPAKADVPIIALTANALASDREACLAAGMSDFISKPLTSFTLSAMMEKYMPVVRENQRKQAGEG